MKLRLCVQYILTCPAWWAPGRFAVPGGSDWRGPTASFVTLKNTSASPVCRLRIVFAQQNSKYPLLLNVTCRSAEVQLSLQASLKFPAFEPHAHCYFKKQILLLSPLIR